MTKRLSKPNARGLFPCEKGGHTFYLGTERQEAERRKAAIESIFAASGNEWNCMSKTVAMAVARGDKTLTVDPPAEYIGKPDHLARALQNTQAAYPWIQLVYAGVELAREGEVMLDAFWDRQEATAKKSLAGIQSARTFGGNSQKLHAAFDAYAAAMKEKYVSLEDGMPTEYAMTEERNFDFIKKCFADMPLTKFDMDGIDKLLGTIAKRPLNKKGKPIAVNTVRHLVKAIRRFIRWLNKAKDWAWKKPYDYEVERITVQETNAEIQARYNPSNNEVFTPDQIRTLFKYATPGERVLFVMGLNFGFKPAETLRVQTGEYDLAEKLLARVRTKTRVYGQWRLWDVTGLALAWAEKSRPNKEDATLIQTRNGEALGKRTEGGNRGGKIANFWNRLLDRIQKDFPKFPRLPYSTLRDTGASAIREIAGGEIAEMYLSHGNPIPSGALLEKYANKPWAKLHDALTKWGNQLADCFAVADPFPADYQPSNISISKGLTERIHSLRQQGFKLRRIAEIVGCSFYAVRTYAKKQTT
jgi:integrase